MTPKSAFLEASEITPADPFAGAGLLLVTPDAAFTDIHTLLVSEKRGDKVHPLSCDDELKTRRLGDENASKRAYALAVPEAAGQQKVAAVVYTHWSARNGALPCDVDEILKADSVALSEKPDTVTFYSISSFMRGAGERLIIELHKKLTAEHPGLILTTLSPLRTLRAWIEQNGGAGDDLKEMARQCLLANQDPVQKFHLSNGACIGAINLDANHGQSADAIDGLGVMVNYVYPSDPAQLAANAARYKGGEVIFGLAGAPKNTPRIPAKAGVQPK